MRFAIAGIGLVGQRHAEAIVQVPDVCLCAIVDPSDAGKAAAQRLDVPWYDDLPSMIHSEQPDGIILSTPTKLHVEQGDACLAAGIPVLVEKPLADDLKAATIFVEQAEKADVALLVGHHRRHNPLIRKAYEYIQNGKIGAVRAVQATCWFYKPDVYFDVAPWRKQKGAGPISVNLVHDIDLMRHLCGEITSVQAQAAPSLRGYENEDVAAALLTFENGAIGTISVSDSIVAPWSWEMTAHEYPIYPTTSQSAYQIGGSHGALSIPDLTLWTHEEKRDWWTPISATSVLRDTSDPLINQMAHFAAVVRGDEAPLVSGREGLRSLAVVDAIQKSAKSGELVRLGDGHTENDPTNAVGRATNMKETKAKIAN
ncbi:Gfo/Idh/MocA family protein [Tropicibacter sp. Alg240-R139]|uniref:Gfo/Idh/MocA family protein n=1 Tax=Tropicibacter sp. Alg240-R139 TaxID=2305991 RepID=UPI0013DFDBF3|nr:Gfo/Idh/MocA family oxidoreductase [Tropicibacter sp. Alg240-R139]